MLTLRHDNSLEGLSVLSSPKIRKRPLITNHRLAFTLVELLVVIAIIGVLVSLLLPAVQAAREAARRSSCVNNLRQLSLAALNYESSKGEMPPGSHFKVNPDNNSCSNGRGTPLYVYLFPYIELSTLYDRWDHDHGWIMQAGPPDERQAIQEEMWQTQVNLLQCPSYTGTAETNPARRDYYGCTGGANTFNSSSGRFNLNPRHPNADQTYATNLGTVYSDGIFYQNSFVKLQEVLDGTSQTFAFGEAIQGTNAGLDAPGGFHNAPAPLSAQGPGAWWMGGAYGSESESPREVASPSNGCYDDAFISGRMLRSTHNPVNTIFDPISPIESGQASFGSYHPGGAHFSFVDGHTIFISDAIDEQPYRFLSGRGEGQVLDLSSL